MALSQFNFISIPIHHNFNFLTICLPTPPPTTPRKTNEISSPRFSQWENSELSGCVKQTAIRCISSLGQIAPLLVRQYLMNTPQADLCTYLRTCCCQCIDMLHDNRWAVEECKTDGDVETTFCLIRTHAEGSVRVDYKGESDVGRWVWGFCAHVRCLRSAGLTIGIMSQPPY
jgi:hypothetical protein